MALFRNTTRNLKVDIDAEELNAAVDRLEAVAERLEDATRKANLVLTALKRETSIATDVQRQLGHKRG